MHDPMVVAFDIRRPWPTRSTCGGKGKRFAWRRWSPFVTVFGRSWYFPSLVTIWHVEPGGRDSGEVCKHISRWQDGDGKWHSKPLRAWKWHVHHWHLQVAPLQHLRRWALTRCAWCGGRSRKGDQVNVSHSWDGERGPWWRGERGLYHRDCSTVRTAHRTCTCDAPLTEHDGYGLCLLCNRHRSYGQSEKWTMSADKLRESIPERGRDRDLYARIVNREATP